MSRALATANWFCPLASKECGSAAGSVIIAVTCTWLPPIWATTEPQTSVVVTTATAAAAVLEPAVVDDPAGAELHPLTAPTATAVAAAIAARTRCPLRIPSISLVDNHYHIHKA